MLVYSLEVGICWAVLYLLYLMFMRTETFFSVNRWYLLCSLLLGLLIPVLKTIPVYVQEETVFVSEALYFISVGPETIADNILIESETKSLFSIQDLLFLLYCIGLVFMGCRMFFGLYKIKNLYDDGEHIKNEKFKIIRTNSSHLPFSFLNCIFLSKHIPLNNDLEKILNHELTHVRSWHTLDVLFIELVQIAFWFNPLVILYKKAIKESHEYLADASVLQDTSRKIYGQILLRQSQSGLQIALANHFFHSHIKNRLLMMKQKRSKWPAMIKYLVALPAILILMLLFQSQTKPILDSDKTPVQDPCSQIPISLFEGEEKEMLYSERKKFNGLEILSGEVAVNRFGEKAEGRVVFNTLDTEDYVLNSNYVKSRFYKDKGGWRFSYISAERGSIGIIIKDKDFKIVKSMQVEKLEETMDFAISELNSPVDIFQLIVSESDGKSISTEVIDFSIGKKFIHEMFDVFDELEKKDANKPAVKTSDKDKEVNKTKSKCKAGRDGVYYYSDIRASVTSCQHIDEDCKKSSCTSDAMSHFFHDRVRAPIKSIEEGFEGMLIYTLTISEEGKIERAEIPKNLSENKFGYHEETERIIELMKEEMEFSPAKCDGTKVKSRLTLVANIKLTAEQKRQVKVRNSQSVQKIDKRITLNRASSEGGLGFTYSSNMNVPLTLEITDPKGTVVYSNEWDYMYRHAGDYFSMDQPINGTYTVKAVQDGLTTESQMTIEVY